MIYVVDIYYINKSVVHGGQKYEMHILLLIVLFTWHNCIACFYNVTIISSLLPEQDTVI